MARRRRHKDIGSSTVSCENLFDQQFRACPRGLDLSAITATRSALVMATRLCNENRRVSQIYRGATTPCVASPSLPHSDNMGAALNAVARRLNERPRKALGFRTPRTSSNKCCPDWLSSPQFFGESPVPSSPSSARASASSPRRAPRWSGGHLKPEFPARSHFDRRSRSGCQNRRFLFPKTPRGDTLGAAAHLPNAFGAQGRKQNHHPTP